MKRQDGYLTKESGAWLGHYSRWITDYSTGERKRQQRAFKIGPVSMTKTQARDKLRERIVSELSITADSRVASNHESAIGGLCAARSEPARAGPRGESATGLCGACSAPIRPRSREWR